jgi:hypothetical protein
MVLGTIEIDDVNRTEKELVRQVPNPFRRRLPWPLSSSPGPSRADFPFQVARPDKSRACRRRRNYVIEIQVSTFPLPAIQESSNK